MIVRLTVTDRLKKTVQFCAKLENPLEITENPWNYHTFKNP